MYKTGTYKVTTGPASEPLTASEAKLYLKVDASTDDALITSLIQAARESCEKYLQMALISQTITEKFYCFKPYGLRLSVSPMISVSSVAYLDSGGNSQTLSTDIYGVKDGEKPPLIYLKYGQVWPATYAQTDAITVTYLAGYANAAAVPALIKTAMYMILAEWYNNRQDSVRNMPTAAQWFLDQFRISWF